MGLLVQNLKGVAIVFFFFNRQNLLSQASEKEHHQKDNITKVSYIYGTPLR